MVQEFFVVKIYVCEYYKWFIHIQTLDRLRSQCQQFQQLDVGTCNKTKTLTTKNKYWNYFPPFWLVKVSLSMNVTKKKYGIKQKHKSTHRIFSIYKIKYKQLPSWHFFSNYATTHGWWCMCVCFGFKAAHKYTHVRINEWFFFCKKWSCN